MDKNLSKINLKWLILFILLAFIGWQLYKPKPEPPPPISIYDQGYLNKPVLGPDFGNKNFYVTEVDPNIICYWYKNDYALGNKVRGGDCGNGKIPYPWRVIIHKDVLSRIEVQEPRGDKIGGIRGIGYIPL